MARNDQRAQPPGVAVVFCLHLLVSLSGCAYHGFRTLSNLDAAAPSAPQGLSLLCGGYKQRSTHAGGASPEGATLIVSQGGGTLLQRPISEETPVFKVAVPPGTVTVEIVQGDVLRHFDVEIEFFPITVPTPALFEIERSSYYFTGPNRFVAEVDAPPNTSVYLGEVVEKGLRAYPQGRQREPREHDYTSIGVAAVDLMAWFEESPSSPSRLLAQDVRVPDTYFETWRSNDANYRAFFANCRASRPHFEKKILTFSPEWRP